MSPDAVISDVLAWMRSNSTLVLIGVAAVWSVVVALIFFSEPSEVGGRKNLSRRTLRLLKKQREEIQRGSQEDADHRRSTSGP